MKKILTLIGSISLGVASASSAVACSNSANASNDSATEIANKITNKNLSVLPTTPTDTTNKTTIDNITQALVKANPKLNSYDLSKITYAKATLQMNTDIAVTANIMVSQQDKASVSLKITLLPTANFLKQAVTKTEITLPIGTDVDFDPANYNDLQAMNTAVLGDNKDLKSGDMVYFQYQKATLGLGAPGKPVQVTIKVPWEPAQTASLTLSVYVTPYAETIKEKIKDTNISVAMSNPSDITSSVNTNILNNALLKANHTTSATSLQQGDLKYLSYSGSLKPGEPATVTLTIKVSDVDKTTMSITVTVLKATGLAQLITNSEMDITTIKLVPEAAVTTDNPIVIAVINNSLLQYYPSLTAEDFQFFSYSTATLTANQSVDVTLKITIGDDTASKDLKITMTSAVTIMGKIKTKGISVPADTPTSTTDPNTIAAINTALKTANPDLNNGDVLPFSYTSKTPLKAGTAVDVTLKISLYLTPNQSDTASETITVTLLQPS